jgi:hypothetical protein
MVSCRSLKGARPGGFPFFFGDLAASRRCSGCKDKAKDSKSHNAGSPDGQPVFYSISGVG